MPTHVQIFREGGGRASGTEGGGGNKRRIMAKPSKKAVQAVSIGDERRSHTGTPTSQSSSSGSRAAKQ